jgi:hypothetical protein
MQMPEIRDEVTALDEEQMRAELTEIILGQGFMASVIECEDDPAKVATLSVTDALHAFIGNCWGDHHDGGEHRRDLRLAHRLLEWMGAAVDPGVYQQIDNLGDPTIWPDDPDDVTAVPGGE